MEFTRQGLQAEGFQGFASFESLCADRCTYVPKAGGVYVVVRELDAAPIFLSENPGSHHKGKNPTL